jgi:hypothetical protein
VTRLAEIAQEPREAVQLAEAGKFREAAAAGTAILRLPREQFRDFTWDYLGNATAWAYVQMENLPAAADTHLAAGQRIDDPALAEYHKIATGVLGRDGASADAVKTYAAYQAELRKALQGRLEKFKRDAAAGRKIENADVRLRHIRESYSGLRVLAATDPDTGKQEQATFRQGAKGLAIDVIPAQLKEGRRIQKRLVDMSVLLKHKQNAEWNATVRSLWGKVQYIKCLCRIYDHMARKNLAESANTTEMFAEAHRLLFTPDNGRLVWQEVGLVRVFNGVGQEDIRLKVPYQESTITPWGVKPSGQQGTPGAAWKPAGSMTPIDGKMTPMNGTMKPMDGGMTPMDGGMTPMDSGMTPMDGKMTPMKPVKK